MNIPQIIESAHKKYRLQQIVSEWSRFLEHIEQHNPKVIVDIGIASGASTLCLSHFAECVISVDCTKPSNRVVFADIKQYCEYHFILEDTSRSRCTEIVEDRLDGRKIDVLFIDGEHSYRGAKRDFEKFSPMVADGGIIALHDIVDSPAHRSMGCKVFKFWDEIKNEYESFELTTTDWGGIGVITYK